MQLTLANTPSERAHQMDEHYIQLHESGWSISDISKKYLISPWTVYSHLQRIADENRVTRESLLVYPHSTHNTASVVYTEAERKKVKEVMKSAQELIEFLTKVREEANLSALSANNDTY